MVRTPDLRLATFLVARGHALVGHEVQGRRVILLIDATDEEAKRFYGDDDLASVKRIFETWRSLRNVVDAAVPR